MAVITKNLEKWLFAYGDAEECLENGHEVTVPHTWNVEEESQEASGIGWYSCRLPIEPDWQGKRIRIRFRGVVRDTVVYLNGEEVGSHLHSGYTPFTVEITKSLRWDGDNILTVRVDNRFSDASLPYQKSFDWPKDGGLIRPVEILVTGSGYLEKVRVVAKPILTTEGERQDCGGAIFGLSARINGDPELPWRCVWTLREGAHADVHTDAHTDAHTLEEAGGGHNGAGEAKAPFTDKANDKSFTPLTGEAVIRDGKITVPGHVLENLLYWHFDRPHVYTLQLLLYCDAPAAEHSEPQQPITEHHPESQQRIAKHSEPQQKIADRQEITVGFRDLRLRGERLLLNGEAVRLPGTEWMPGSDPACGMAESREQLEKMLLCLKETNSVLTRFHWQQDDWVYDWCDRNGLLVQEEIPFWGGDPEEPGEQQWKVFTEQFDEMLEAHANHPSIISWGVGNELRSLKHATILYIKHAVAYAHRLDPDRTVNYVSNAIFNGHDTDGTLYGDILMVNDYIGTWHQGYDQYGEWEAIIRENPGRAMIPSEFGLCEPAHAGGDERRAEIFREKIGCYRSFPCIVGTVNFCLNDYRTHMGEEGEGRMRRRVHGSTDLCGNPKPSYYVVRKEYAPLIPECNDRTVTLTCQNTLPCYTVKGYSMQVRGETLPIPDLKPGEQWSVTLTEDGKALQTEEIRIFRGTGQRVL